MRSAKQAVEVKQNLIILFALANKTAYETRGLCVNEKLKNLFTRTEPNDILPGFRPWQDTPTCKVQHR